MPVELDFISFTGAGLGTRETFLHGSTGESPLFSANRKALLANWPIAEIVLDLASMTRYF